MQEINDLGRTAFVIAAVRAGESTRAGALFHDPYAAVFSVPEITAATRGYEAMAPFLTNSVRLRTWFIDETLARALDGGTGQVVILGSGLDCRALRFHRPGVAFFEVDQPAMLDFKNRRLASAGHKNPAAAVDADYTRPGLVEALAARGFDPAARSLVIWEGNTFYLPPEVIQQVLHALAGGLGSARVVLDYFKSSVIAGNSRSPSMRAVIPMLRKFGAPWQGYIDDIEALAGAAGMDVEAVLGTPEVYARVPGDSMSLGEDLHAEYFLGVLATQAKA